MKKLIILLIALIPVVSLSASSKLKVIEGNTAFLKLSPSKIEVKWDFSNTFLVFRYLEV